MVLPSHFVKLLYSKYFVGKSFREKMMVLLQLSCAFAFTLDDLWSDWPTACLGEDGKFTCVSPSTNLPAATFQTALCGNSTNFRSTCFRQSSYWNTAKPVQSDKHCIIGSLNQDAITALLYWRKQRVMQIEELLMLSVHGTNEFTILEHL